MRDPFAGIAHFPDQGGRHDQKHSNRNDEAKGKPKMCAELAKTQTHPLANFLGYTDEIARADNGDHSNIRGGILPGTRMKFDNTGAWITHPDGVAYTGKKVIVVNNRRVLVKWIGNMPVETEELAPGAPWPDVEARNDAAGKEEWREDLNGVLVGPWQAQRILEFFDPTTLTRLSWPTATIGGRIAINDLIDKVRWMAKFHRDQAIYPLVVLCSKTMRTSFGPRPRPHFEVRQWVRLGEHGVEPVDTDQRSLLQQRQVNEPSVREATRDEIPF
jgi:hypothetical protein